jgi:eukaryotic-like serine/threonine-protein kinase
MNTDFERTRQLYLAIVEQSSAQWEALLNEACAADPDLHQQVAVLLKAHAEGGGILDRDQAGQVPTGVRSAESARCNRQVHEFEREWDMVPVSTDRNLLFGVLALQAGLIDNEQFARSCTLWTAQKDVPLAEVLLQQGWLTPEDRSHVDYLLERKLHKHADDAEASLAAVINGEAQRLLDRVTDPVVQQTLGHLPPRDGPVLLSTVAYQPGSRERYTLTRVHSKGGIGQVWLARDGDLGRDVALKELRPERAEHAGASARFLEEARITGQLEHPGIVPVYELSKRSEDHRPFYTMRFVKGQTLAEAIRAYHRKRVAGQAGPLDLRELLTVLIGVCQAVAYAHSRRVLHRDLKPQNVVLGDFGEVIVLDWGLAKLMDQAEAPTSLLPVAVGPEGSRGQTVQGQVLGTPAYMAPEQAEGRLDRVDRRSDVYSLGALLYEILTGQAPFAGADTESTLRQVIHEDPVAPRQRVAAAPPALEAVCLKALAKTPEDRYATAKELAAAVQHWLADEPVAGYREPLGTRLARLARRHRPLVAGVAALLLTAVAALSVGLVLLGQAGARTEQQRLLAEQNFKEARGNLQMARRAVDDYFVQVSENTLLKSPLPGMQPLRKQLLEAALKYYQEFLRKTGDDPEVKAELAQAYFRVGRITADIGSKEDALVAYQRARELYQALTETEPQTASYRGDLARTFRGIGIAEFMTGRRPEGIASFKQAVALGEELVLRQPEVPEFQRDLAWSYSNLGLALHQSGQTMSSRSYYEQAVSTWKRLMHDHPSAEYRIGLGVAYSNLGEDLTAAGRMTESLDANQQAVALQVTVVNENGADPEYRKRLVLALENLGNVHSYADRPARAREAYDRARVVAEQLVKENPTVVEYRERLILNYIDLGHFLLQTGGEDAEARLLFENALELGKKLPDGSPAYFTYASIHRGLGKLLRKQGRTAEALRALQEAVRIGETGPGGEKPLTTYELACARALCSATVVEQKAKERYADQATKALLQAVAEGWENVPWMKRDPDLDVLRDRKEFKNLMAELEAKHRS